MKNENKQLNSCICKCGCISCRNLHIRSFNHKIQNTNFDDQFVYSILHHRSLYVFNSKSIIVDKCCGNCLFFHCSGCNEQFSIIKLQSFKKKFIFGFNPNCLAHVEITKCNNVVIIPEFPIILKSFVSLLEQKIIERSKNDENSHLLSNHSLNEFEFDENEDDEICTFDSDEDVMFGNCQNNFIIGKYNEHYISSF